MKTMHLANEAIAEACRLPVRAALCALFAANCALVANGAPVAFKDAAKIKSWDAWDDHKTPEPPKEGRSGAIFDSKTLSAWLCWKIAES